MIIKYDFKTYIIDINKLVSIEPKHSQKSYRGAGGIIYYLNIIYEENQSLKEINLIYKYKSAYSLINYANIDQNQMIKIKLKNLFFLLLLYHLNGLYHLYNFHQGKIPVLIQL